jgi:hypothetical protein
VSDHEGHFRERLTRDENYLWLADMQDGATDNLYIDAFHYTAPMSRIIAGKVTDFITEQWLERAVR